MTMWTGEDIARLDIPGLNSYELDVVRSLFKVWRDRLPMNAKRSLYYAGEQGMKDAGLVVPALMKGSKFALGWPTLAVKKHAVRSQFQGLVSAQTADPLELRDTMTRSRFSAEFSQAVHSAGQHGASLLVVSADDDGHAVAHAHSFEDSAALWDWGTRRVGAALTISRYDEQRPAAFTVYLPESCLFIEKVGGKWAVGSVPHSLGRAPVVAVPYDPQIKRPFGRSRLTHPVMMIADMAARAYVRMEHNAEIYSSPLLAIEGLDVDDEVEQSPTAALRMKLARDRAIAVTKDMDGDKPMIKQLQQATMTPHSDMLRTLAMAFSGETGIPPSSLGIIHDNPSSAEAIRAAEHDLLIDVTYQNGYVLAHAVEEAARLMWMTMNPGEALPDEAWSMQAQFADPEFRSSTGMADVAVKLDAIEALKGTTIPLEQMYGPADIQRIEDTRRRTAGESLLDKVLASRAQAQPNTGVTDGEPG